MKSFYFILFISLISCGHDDKELEADWCDQPLRSQFLDMKQLVVSGDWFKVYEVGEGVYAIAEPYNYQEVISYLIIGSQKALLFDSGMGMSSISETVKELTNLPVTVLNSHTHYDHIGGNSEFETILAMNI
jgi:mRNA-degrading endonuclease YafQ of YafQ-DinJ toxin-antitoxin module